LLDCIFAGSVKQQKRAAAMAAQKHFEKESSWAIAPVGVADGFFTAAPGLIPLSRSHAAPGVP
jgi:hypothetical protein